MKVLLLKDVPGTGQKNDIKDVREGYARNFLIPKKLAAPATPATVSAREKEKKHQEVRQETDRKKYQEIADRLTSAEITITAKIGEKGKAFGSIGAADIKKALEKQKIVVEEEWITLESSIKTTGTVNVPFKFPYEVEGSLSVTVKPE